MIINSVVTNIQQGGGGLPSGYTAIDWIGSTGTQYIDTGYKPKDSTRVLCFVIRGTAGDDNYNVFGARDAGATNRYTFALIRDINKFRSDFGSSGGTETSYISSSTDIILKSSSYTFCNSAVSNLSGQSFQTNSNLYLFGWNNNGSLLASTSQIKIRFVAIYDNMTLERYMVACIRNSDSEAGMYDLVNNQFYTNAGTGTFTKGADV